MLSERSQTQRAVHRMVHLYCTLEKAEPLGQKTDQWIRSFGGGGNGDLLQKERRELFGAMKISCNLDCGGGHMAVRTCQFRTVGLKWVNFTRLYIDKLNCPLREMHRKVKNKMKVKTLEMS